jgi:hypothetical protein
MSLTREVVPAAVVTPRLATRGCSRWGDCAFPRAPRPRTALSPLPVSGGNRPRPRRKRKTQARKPGPQPVYRADAPALQVQDPHAAGIDAHSDNHAVCVGPGRVETCGAYTADLYASAEHLRRAGAITVALGSSGVYWIPLREHLEGQGFECYLIEPGQLHGCGARPKIAFQVIATLEAESRANAGVEELLPQRFSEPSALPDEGGYDCDQEEQIDQEAKEGGHSQQRAEGRESHSKAGQ